MSNYTCLQNANWKKHFNVFCYKVQLYSKTRVFKNADDWRSDCSIITIILSVFLLLSLSSSSLLSRPFYVMHIGLYC